MSTKSKKASSETILQEAERIINGDRHDTYGEVSESFSSIARLWSAYLSRQATVNITSEDVVNMMILLKVSRTQGTYHRDSYVDIAGYAGCVENMRNGESPK